jgi:NMD protein affecting ribosome stability and mRNA decay
MIATKYNCHACRIKFIVEMDFPHCPKCTRKERVSTAPLAHVRVKRREWTEEELKQLTHLYQTTDMSHREIGKAIGRTKESVCRKIQRLSGRG